MKFVIGIDEAGRGPLAGPVAVGAAMVAWDFDWNLVDGAKDSKKMTPRSRDCLYDKMEALREEKILDFAVAFSSSTFIDQYGIVPAIKSALARVLSKLTENIKDGPLCEVLLDGGLRAPEEFAVQRTIVRGDDTEPLISLASIVAKVERDRLMCRLAKKYPLYGFDMHKGYGTVAHCDIIRKNGLSEIHRRSFCTGLISSHE